MANNSNMPIPQEVRALLPTGGAEFILLSIMSNRMRKENGQFEKGNEIVKGMRLQKNNKLSAKYEMIRFDELIGMSRRRVNDVAPPCLMSVW